MLLHPAELGGANRPRFVGVSNFLTFFYGKLGVCIYPRSCSDPRGRRGGNSTFLFEFRVNIRDSWVFRVQKAAHSHAFLFFGQNLHRRLVFSEVGFPENSGHPWILAFLRLWELPRTPPERTISLRIWPKNTHPQIFSSSVCATIPSSKRSPDED